jgi:hypothetical protein
MNEHLIRKIANQSSTYAEDTVEYYGGIAADGLTWDSKILKSRDLKFAELIVRECADFIDAHKRVDEYGLACDIVYGEDLMKHLGFGK